ncbi:MAG: QueT transporter family protein [Clostridia bacterium]
MKTSFLARAGIIAALYAVLTLALPFIGFGPIQLRIAEALCVLPFFMKDAVPGLFIGCLAANAIGMAFGLTTPWDIVIGSLATLIAAYMSSRIRHEWLVPLPSVIVNALVIGTMLTLVYTPGTGIVPLLYNIGTVAAGQVLSCYLLGMPLLKLLKKYKWS